MVSALFLSIRIVPLVVFGNKMTNVYRMKEIFSLVFVNHEPGLGRTGCTLVLYDTNQKISYNTAYYCMVLVLQVPVSKYTRSTIRSIGTNRLSRTLNIPREAIVNVPASKCVSILLVSSYMSNVAKRWGMTNIYRTNEIFSLVFINHELDS